MIDNLENLLVDVAAASCQCLVESSEHSADLFGEVAIRTYLNVERLQLLRQALFNTFPVPKLFPVDFVEVLDQKDQ